MSELKNPKDCDNGTEHQQHRAINQVHPGWQQWYRNPEYVFAAAIVSFTFVLMLTSIWQGWVITQQWNAMIEANRLSRESFTSVQRAFVTINKFDFSVHMGDIPPYLKRVKYHMFTPISENSGNTPTKNLRYLTIATCPINLATKAVVMANPIRLAGAFQCPPQSLEPSDPEKTWNETKFKVMPQNALLGPHANAPMGTIGFPDDIINAITGDDNWVWYISGMVRYNDIFMGSPEHITKFCYEFRIERSAQGSIPQYRFCKHWNCSDDECQIDKQAYETEQAEKPAMKVPSPSVQ